jgi:hypothetical protein
MRSGATRWLGLAVLLTVVVARGDAQQHSAAASLADPRVGLKAGLRDAGHAARGMELVASLPKPEGFFDPKAPAGETVPPERDPATGVDDPDQAAVSLLRARPPIQPPRRLSFANSDLAFQRDNLWIGNYHGLNAYNIENVRNPRLEVSVVCPGGQGDVSVYGKLLFMSVEQRLGRVDCGTEGVEAPVSTERFRGIRIFDISSLGKPKQIAAVQTCRGSHTHTLVTDPRDKTNLYVYASGTGFARSSAELAECSALPPNEDPNTAFFSIDVIQVPLAAPQSARIVNRPRIFADVKTGAVAGLNRGGNQGPGTQTASETNQCHDITAFPEIGLAAGACAGNGILLDISDPAHPVRIDEVADRNFAYWHSATFNADGSKVIFTDEWGGGTRPRCRATDRPTWGADAIFDIVDRKLRFASYYKMPAPQTEQENCVAHNGSLIPVPGRDIMVQAWYQGGVSVFDFTDSARPIEIAFFDRGPVDPSRLVIGGYWSTYWYNGAIYGSEIIRGLDIFRLIPTEHLSRNEIDAANEVHLDALNVQNQRRVTWPATAVVARAYLDQLARSRGILPERTTAVTSTLARLDRVGSRRDRNAAAVVARADALTTQLEQYARAASARDGARLRALAALIQSRASRLR